jgi:hypothetical protein
VAQPLVYLERTRHVLELFVGEVRERGLGDRDEGRVIRDREHREAEPVRLLDERGWDLGEAEADAEAERCEPVVGEPSHVGPLGKDRSPTPSPVVSRSSPPSSQAVGSESSETCSQRTSRASPAEPPATVIASSSIDAMSRTVSIGRAG